MQLSSNKSEKAIRAIPENKPQNKSKTVATPDHAEAILLFALVAKLGKARFGSISVTDVLQAMRSKRLQVVKATGHELVVVESAENRVKVSIRLSPGIIDALLRASKQNPGALAPRCHDACSYLNNDCLKKKLLNLAGKRGAAITLTGNSIVFA